MEYSEQFNYLNKAFELGKEQCLFPESGTEAWNFDFESATGFSSGQPLIYTEPNGRQVFDGNMSFRYPVFVPAQKRRHHKAIFLFHGLNERSWTKYLSWASELSIKSGHAVILFPIAFHMNRSPREWSNPRAMSSLMFDRKSGSSAASVANAALSVRLEQQPSLFCTSGIQSYYDVIKLIQQARSGNHPLLAEDCQFDFFAYSIGAFLTQILLLSNPDDVFKDSKTMLFCGGSSFEDMNGISRLIMDDKAFASLKNFYLGQDTEQIRSEIERPSLQGFPYLWRSFIAMLRKNYLRDFREQCFDGIKNRFLSVSLLRDQVIPAQAVKENLRTGSRHLKNIILDFPYPYAHENPFPVNKPGLQPQVDRSFRQIMSIAGSFF